MKKIDCFSTIIGGVILAIIYFLLEESNIDRKNGILPCRYFHPFSVDLLAFLIGGFLVYTGCNDDNPLVTISGTSIVMIHAFHFITYKILER